MNFGLFFVVLVISLQVTAARHRRRKDTDSDNGDPDYEYEFKGHAEEDHDDAEDETPDDVEFTENEPRAVEPRYEVTEIVDDIPNEEDYRPIIANHSLAKPLNLATPSEPPSRNSVNGNRKRGNRRVFAKHSEKYTHKDFFDFEEVIPTIKESFDGIKTGFINGVKNLGRGVAQAPGIVVDKIHGIESFDGIKNGFINGVKNFGRGVAQAPGIVVDKIHSKGSDFVKTVHSFFHGRNRGDNY